MRSILLITLALAVAPGCRGEKTEAWTNDPIFGGGDTTGSCGMLVPDLSTSPQLASPWNPPANGIQDGTETAIDAGGTWATLAPQIPTPVATSSSVNPSCRLDASATSNGVCTPTGAIPGRLLQLTLNGIDYRCFFPASPTISEKVVILNTRATIGNGTMHSNNDTYSFPVSNSFHGSCGYFPPHGGHPLHLAARGVVALGIYLRTHHPEDVDKFILTGQSFGSFMAPVAALIGQGHPLFPVAGIVGSGGLGVQENPRFFDGIEFLLGANHASGGVYGPYGEDSEVIRTLKESFGIDSLADIDFTNYASSWSIHTWLFLGGEDPTTWADYQTKRLAQLFPGGDLVHVFHTELGSHKGDGFVKKKLGTFDPYAGVDKTFDLIEAIDFFIQLEVLGKPVPVATPIAIGAQAQAPSTVDFVRNLSPDLTAPPSGTLPNLLALDRRVGLGAFAGAFDSLVVHNDAQGHTRLTIGGLSGVVRQVVVTGGGTGVQELWRTPVGYGVSGLLDLGDDGLLAVTKDGRAARLRRSTGEILRITPPFHLGHKPRNGKLGTAYSVAGGAPVPHTLAFYLNEEGTLIGIDPTDLAIRYQSDSAGFFEDWDFTSGGPLDTAWIGAQRGHLIRVALQLPDCMHVLAMTEYLGAVPKRVLALGQNVLAVDGVQQHLFLADGAKVPLPKVAGTNLSALIGTTTITATIDVLDIIPNTTLALWWQAPTNTYGITDLAGFASHPNVPVPPIARGTSTRRVMSLAGLGLRAFGTTDNGAAFELELVAPPGGTPELVGDVLQLPLSARGMTRNPTTGHIVALTQIPDARGLSLVDVDFTAAQPTTVLSSAYVAVAASPIELATRLLWSGGAYYTVYEGALAAIGGALRVFAPRTFDVNFGPALGLLDLNDGHLISYPVASPTGGTAGVPLVAPNLGGPKITYDKFTNNMGGLFNENGSSLMIHDADGHYTGYFATAGGYVFKQRFHGQTAQALGPALRSESLGWKGADIIMGKHRTPNGQLVDALYVGLWLFAGRDHGGVAVVDPQTLQLIEEIESGDVSFGVLQANITGDAGLELIVGSAKAITVYDENYQVLHRTREETAAYGSFGRLWYDGQYLVAGTIDGLERYRINAH